MLDVGLALLSCIPCTKGLTSLGELSAAFKSGGMLGADAHLLGRARTRRSAFCARRNDCGSVVQPE